MGVWGLRSTLTVYHNFFPWVVIRWLDGHLLLFRGTLAKSDAGQTIVDPTFHVRLHGWPINQLHQQRQRDRKVPVDSEDAGVELKETPFFLLQRSRSVAGRNPRDPSRFLMFRFDQFL